MNNLVITLALLFALFGVWSLCRIVFTLFKNIRVKGWPIIQGKVLVSKVVKIGASTEDSSYHLPKVIYEYCVNNQTYKSSKVYVSYISSSNIYISKEIVSRYPEDSVVYAYFNPKKPSEAYLQPNIEVGQIIVAVIGALVALLFAYFMFKDIEPSYLSGLWLSILDKLS